jgi:hypothetical protein
MGLPAGYPFSWQREGHSRTGTRMWDFTEEEEVSEHVERWPHRNSILSSSLFKFIMIVCKTSVNEESVIVENCNNDQLQRLLSLRKFLGTDSCLPTSVRSIVTEGRTARGGRLQVVPLGTTPWRCVVCGGGESSRILNLDNVWSIKLSTSSRNESGLIDHSGCWKLKSRCLCNVWILSWHFNLPVQ